VQPGLDTLSVRQQCDLLQVSRSGLYYQPVEVSAEELHLLRSIDELYLVWPFYGSRRMTVALQQEGHEVNRKRVQRLMRIMGLEGMAPGPHTRRPHLEPCTSTAPASLNRWRDSTGFHSSPQLASLPPRPPRHDHHDGVSTHSHRRLRRKDGSPQSGPANGVHLIYAERTWTQPEFLY